MDGKPFDQKGNLLYMLPLSDKSLQTEGAADTARRAQETLETLDSAMLHNMTAVLLQPGCYERYYKQDHVMYDMLFRKLQEEVLEAARSADHSVWQVEELLDVLYFVRALLLQQPTAALVAGFERWSQKLHRHRD